MLLEISLLLYSLISITFFVVLLRDKYVVLNKAVVLVYIIASIFWPLTGAFYYLDKD